MLLSKEDFVSVMTELMEMSDYHDSLNNFFKKHHVDGYLIQPDCTSAVVRLLHSIFAEKDSTEIISYWMFELDFGRSKAHVVRDENGKVIPLATAEDLYDYLVS